MHSIPSFFPKFCQNISQNKIQNFLCGNVKLFILAFCSQLFNCFLQFHSILERSDVFDSQSYCSETSTFIFPTQCERLHGDEKIISKWSMHLTEHRYFSFIWKTSSFIFPNLNLKDELCIISLKSWYCTFSFQQKRKVEK